MTEYELGDQGELCYSAAEATLSTEVRRMLEATVRKAAEAKYGKLDLLAAAWVGELGYLPSKGELVEDHTDPTKVTYYYRERK